MMICIHIPRSRYWNFTSLGLRVTSFLISPWVEKGVVIQEPSGPTNTSQFELSSIPATIHSLFNLSMFLTKRDEWAGTFDELLLDEVRCLLIVAVLDCFATDCDCFATDSRLIWGLF